MFREDTIRDENIVRDKVFFYRDNQVSVHLTLHKRFYNGLILEIYDSYFIIDDEVIGETPIYFDELINIEKRRKKI